MPWFRSHALNQQALLKTAPFGLGKAAVNRAIQHLGYIQIDTISVVERAHHHVLFSRVPNYQPTMLESLLACGQVFEYWSHAAAFLPMQDYRFSLPYKQAIKQGKTHWFKNPDHTLMANILSRIRTEGALSSRDLEAGSSKQQGWWQWKPAKKALEQLYMQGDVMVSRREGFQKVYDLTERVLPDGVDATVPTVEDFAQHLVQQQLRCHGVVTQKGVTYLRRNPALTQAVKRRVQEEVAIGDLQSVSLPSGEVFYAKPALFSQSKPRVSPRLRILSPFDNAVIQRDRLKTLFDFDYQIECYVPAAKRRFGYFCLPLLYGDRFIGRMDCKAHRKEQRLEIKSLHWHVDDVDEPLVTAFCRELKAFTRFQQCDTVTIGQVFPQRLQAVIKTRLNQLVD